MNGEINFFGEKGFSKKFGSSKSHFSKLKQAFFQNLGRSQNVKILENKKRNFFSPQRRGSFFLKKARKFLKQPFDKNENSGDHHLSSSHL